MVHNIAAYAVPREAVSVWRTRGNYLDAGAEPAPGDGAAGGRTAAVAGGKLDMAVLQAADNGIVDRRSMRLSIPSNQHFEAPTSPHEAHAV